MKKKYFIAFCLGFSVSLSAQDNADKEIEKIMTSIVNQINNVKSIKKVVMEDFIENDGSINKLGLNLSEEASIALVRLPKRFELADKISLNEENSNKKSSGFNFAAASQMLKQTTESVTDPTINSKTVKAADDASKVISFLGSTNLFKPKNSKYKGVEAVITGMITETDYFYRLTIKVINTDKNNTIVAADKVDIAKNPSFDKMFADKMSKKGNQQGLTNNKSVEVFKKNNVSFELIECKQIGNTVECLLTITNTGNFDMDLYIYGANEKDSRIMDISTGNEYYVGNMKLSEKTNEREVAKQLIINAPINAIITFGNVRNTVQKLSKFQIHCHTQESGYFNVEMHDIDVK